MSFLDQSKGEVKKNKAVLDLLRLRIHCHILCLFFCLFFFFQGNNRLTDASVKVLARSCPLLEHVYLVDCPRMTDLALKALATSKHLHVVNVADCVR